MRIAGYEVHPAAAVFPMLSGSELTELAEDIATNGQREDIWIFENRILDGRNRAKACEMAGIPVRSRDWEGDDPIAFVLSMNLHRRHLGETERAMVAARLKVMFEADSRERSDHAKPPAGGRSRERAAVSLNVSARNVHAAAKVLDSGNDELIAACDRGRVAVSSAALLTQRPVDEQFEILDMVESKKAKDLKSAMRAYDKSKVVESLKSEPETPTDGPYRVIVVDPPWRYDSNRDDGERRGETDYPSMTVEQIKDLPVRDLVDEDGAIVWLWTTNAHLVSGEALAVLTAWELEPKTVLTWVKPKMGVGTWLRGQTEHCILAVFGRATVDLTNQSTLLAAPVREHSRKPHEFFGLVEALCPGSKLELFARESREGWTTRGAEATKFDETA